METFDNYWSGGHPDIKLFFLVSSVYPLITIITLYVVFVKFVGPYIMRNRKPVQMRPLIVAYNFSLVIFYILYLVRGALFIPEMGFSMFCGSLLQYDKYGIDIVKDVFIHVYILYVSKFVELLDTVFLVLSKKFNMITPLHVFHHSIVPVFGWIGLRSESSGYLGAFVAVNSTVHVIMYTYYAIAALGPKYKKYIWWKKYLTSFQILQFLVMTIYMSFMYAFGCCTSLSVFLFSNFLSVLFFYMFIKFYIGAFYKVKKMESSQQNGFQNSNGLSKENGFHKSNGVHKNGSLPQSYKNGTMKIENNNNYSENSIYT